MNIKIFACLLFLCGNLASFGNIACMEAPSTSANNLLELRIFKIPGRYEFYKLSAKVYLDTLKISADTKVIKSIKDTLNALIGAEAIRSPKLTLLLHSLIELLGSMPDSPEKNSTEKAAEQLATILLDMGANPNLRDGLGNTALHVAVQAGNLALISFLLICGAQVDITNDAGREPGDIALETGNVAALQALYQHERKTCGTNLHAAAQSGDLTAIQRLVELGADIATEDDLGRIPEHVALQAGHEHVVHYLRKKMIKLVSAANSSFPWQLK